MNLKKVKRWTQKRLGAKKLDIKKSIEKMSDDFYVYWPNPAVDLDEYRNEDGSISINDIPDDQLLEFSCRYITGSEFDKIVNPKKPLDFDREKLIVQDKKISDQALQDLLLDAIEKQSSSTPTDTEVSAAVVVQSCTDPQFSSSKQVLDILPMRLIDEICDEAMTFIDKPALVASMEKRIEERNEENQ